MTSSIIIMSVTKSIATDLGLVRVRSTFVPRVTDIGGISSATCLVNYVSTMPSDEHTVNTIYQTRVTYTAHPGDANFHAENEIGILGTTKRRSTGLCTVCKRRISLTALGVLYKHGHGCAGAGAPPVDGSTTSDADNLSQQSQYVDN